MDLNEFLQLKAMEQQRVNFEMTYVDMAGDLIRFTFHYGLD